MRGADGYEDSFPMKSRSITSVVLAYEMNGAPLTTKHGYPARLLVPGIYGMKNCKWITEVELVNWRLQGLLGGPGVGATRRTIRPCRA